MDFHLGTLQGYFFHQDFWPNLNFPLEYQIKLVLICFFSDEKLTKIPDDVSIYLQYLHQDLAIKGKIYVLSRFPEYSKASTYRHANKPIGSPVIDKRHNNPGRPPKLSAHDKRAVLQQVEVLRDTVGHLTSECVFMSAGIGSCVSDECVRHVMHRAGLRYCHSRRKGLLT